MTKVYHGFLAVPAVECWNGTSCSTAILPAKFFMISYAIECWCELQTMLCK